MLHFDEEIENGTWIQYACMEPGPIKLKLNGFPFTYTIRAKVLEDLSDPVNLGSGFLTKVSRKQAVSITYTTGGKPPWSLTSRALP